MIPDPLNIVGTTVLDKYRIESVVGEGGFAIVYRAMHLIWKRPVAIKAFRALGSYAPDKRDMLLEGFIREGQLLAELSERSAAIVQARDIATLTLPDGNAMPCMVLEWLEGETLEAVIERERAQRITLRTVEEVMNVLEPVAEALSLAHHKGIAHRDVKPANIFILGDARGDTFGVKLLDFGIAKVVQDAQKLAGSFNQTVGNVTSFTPAYAAPEQFSRQHGATGPWTDVFALALIFTELLTGRPAIDGDTLAHLAFASTDRNRRPTPRMLGAQVPDAVEAVMLRALAVTPEERYASCGEFWNALRISLALPPLRATHRTGPGISSGGMRATTPLQAPGTGTGPGSGSGGHSEQSLITATGPKPLPANGSGGMKLAIGGAIAASAVAGAVILFFVARTRLHGNTTDESMLPPLPNVAVSGSLSAPVPVPPVPVTCGEGMVRIPGGKFFMGSDDKDGIEFERPAHQVSLGAYCMDIFEVTTGEYKACSNTGDCKHAGRENDWDGITAQERKAFDPLCNVREPDKMAKHPINCVDWTMATSYCVAHKKRLPTEAEWEFAARGSDGRLYPWGDEKPSAAHLNACGKECVAWGKKNGVEETAMYSADDGWANTAPVGSFPEGRSPFGLHDVVGNVWEWTADWFGDYAPDTADNPTGPPTGEARVIRGGGWNGAQPSWVRPTFRYRDAPTKRTYGIGFRCAKSL